jgi:hypothetical protein
VDAFTGDVGCFVFLDFLNDLTTSSLPETRVVAAFAAFALGKDGSLLFGAGEVSLGSFGGFREMYLVVHLKMLELGIFNPLVLKPYEIMLLDD